MAARRVTIKDVAARAGVSIATVSNVLSGRKPVNNELKARVRDAAMYFWVAESQHAKVAGDEGAVVVERKPARRVASRGARGSYSRKNYERTRDELLAWVATQPGLVADGEPYAVFWSGPFTPGFLKRYEVHVPLRPAGGS